MKKTLDTMDIEAIQHLSQSAIICLSDIPREMMKKDPKDGKIYLSCFLGVTKDKATGQPKQAKNGDVCGYISCAPKKEDRQEGKNYFIGNTFTGMWTSDTPSSPEAVEQMQSVTAQDNLPF